MLDPPSVLERRLRQRVGELVAQQAVEDEAAAQAPRGQGLYHRYNAILKRCTGGKARAVMSLSELEAALGWLERNRLADHAAVLDGDERYGWTVRQRHDWAPPVGRAQMRDASRGRQSRDNDATLVANPDRAKVHREMRPPPNVGRTIISEG